MNELSKLIDRNLVNKAEAMMRQMPQIELEVKHHFCKDIYARELHIPKGVTLTGKIHKYQQLNILAKGKIKVLVDNVVKEVEAPFIVVSPPGTKRIAYALEDCVWLTIHGTDEKDVDAIEKKFIAQNEQDYLEFIEDKQLRLDLKMRKFNLDVDEFTDPCTCHAWVATAVIGSAVIGAGASIYSSNQAAKAQENATNTAAGTQMAMYNTTRSDLLPYNTAGQGALKTLQDNNYYTAPITMDQATLEKTPGYQFNLTQGLKAVQNSAAARGLGNSGAALKGAAAFATGLADNTYQNQFNNANTNQTNAYNRLQTIVSGGQNAAAATSNAGVSAANGASNAIIGGGNAAAAGYNAVGGAVTNAANNIGGYYAYKGLYGGGSGTASTSSTSPMGP